MTDAHDELYAKAKAATGGEWRVSNGDEPGPKPCQGPCIWSGGMLLLRIAAWASFDKSNAAYIAAAHPAAILELIDEVRGLKQLADDLNEHLMTVEDSRGEAYAKINSLTAENERMRKALMTIRDGHRCESHKVADDALQIEFMLAHKAALAGERGKA